MTIVGLSENFTFRYSGNLFQGRKEDFRKEGKVKEKFPKDRGLTVKLLNFKVFEQKM